MNINVEVKINELFIEYNGSKRRNPPHLRNVKTLFGKDFNHLKL